MGLRVIEGPGRIKSNFSSLTRWAMGLVLARQRANADTAEAEVIDYTLDKLNKIKKD
jgi:hypothetical protein